MKGTALHAAIRRDLERQIASGRIRVGDWLPSESELQRRYGVSRTPIRHALGELETLGLIRRFQGRGSLVTAARIAAGLHMMVSFSEELRRQGHVVEARTLSLSSGPQEDASRGLRLPPDCDFTTVRRLILVDGQPLALFTHHLAPIVPRDAVAAAGDFESLYALLRDLGLQPFHGIETIAARLLEAEEAELLAVEPPAAAQLRTRISWTEWGAPLEYTVYLVRADRYETRIELRSFGSPAAPSGDVQSQ
jgi:GntR family transcriptional regulator